MEHFISNLLPYIGASFPLAEQAFQLVFAGFLGALVGFERDIHGRNAGLRTHLLVATGATLFMIVSQNVIGGDPSRIAAQIVSGIGFLGAGAIMKEGVTVRGLTTASCLWLVAAVGMAVGEGMYELALFTTMLALLALIGLNGFDKLHKRESYRLLTIVLPHDADTSAILSSVKTPEIKILFVDYDHDSNAQTCTLRLTVKFFHKGPTDAVYESIRKAVLAVETPLRIRWTHGRMS